ncbi:MAG: MATE family efflux transporter [Candidatus Aminicenantes bacterium]|nr:MATE family efflux transporter [Candidatus Aminicenantes bacterium]
MNKEILRLSIPIIISNISIPLLGMVDTALMGRLENEYYIGAVALGSLIFNFVYWGFGFLRMGTTGLTAQAYGRNDPKEIIAILARGLLVAAAGSLVLIALQSVISWFGFSLIPGEESVKSLAEQYFFIRIYAAPATLALYVFYGWFLGMQNAKYPMFLTVLVNLVNIGFNVFFVSFLGMKSDGVALGTVCAQYTGLGLAVILFVSKYRHHVKDYESKIVLKLESVKLFFSVNRDIFIRTICLVFTFAFFTAASSAMEPLILAANQILLQYVSLMAYGVDGFAFAAESLVGRFTGEKNRAALKSAVQKLFIWGCGMGAGFAILYALFKKKLIVVFTDLEPVIETASVYVWWLVVIPVFGAVAYMWDGIYIGATATKPMRNMMLISTLIVFLPVTLLFVRFLGNHGLWLALTLFMIARGTTLTLLSRKHIFQRI